MEGVGCYCVEFAAEGLGGYCVELPPMGLPWESCDTSRSPARAVLVHQLDAMPAQDIHPILLPRL